MDKYTFNQVLKTISDLSENKCLDENKVVVVGKSGESFTTSSISVLECDCAIQDKDDENFLCVDVVDTDNNCWRHISLTDIERIDVYYIG